MSVLETVDCGRYRVGAAVGPCAGLRGEPWERLGGGGACESEQDIVAPRACRVAS